MADTADKTAAKPDEPVWSPDDIVPVDHIQEQDEPGVRRNKNGRILPPHLFKPGQSGNPLGRKREPRILRDLARTHTAEAIETIAEIMRKGNEKHRLIAAGMLLDRGWGKATQVIDSSRLSDSEQSLLTTLTTEQLLERAHHHVLQAAKEHEQDQADLKTVGSKTIDGEATDVTADVTESMTEPKLEEPTA